MPKLFLSALALCAALVIAGCGGSSHSTPTITTSGITKATFVAQLNSVCDRANGAFDKASSEKARVSVIDHYLVVFKSVGVPSDLKSAYSEYVNVLSQELAKLKTGDTAGLRALASTKARPLAVKLGATACANPQ